MVESFSESYVPQPVMNKLPEASPTWARTALTDRVISGPGHENSGRFAADQAI